MSFPWHTRWHCTCALVLGLPILHPCLKSWHGWYLLQCQDCLCCTIAPVPVRYVLHRCSSVRSAATQGCFSIRPAAPASRLPLWHLCTTAAAARTAPLLSHQGYWCCTRAALGCWHGTPASICISAGAFALGTGASATRIPTSDEQPFQKVASCRAAKQHTVQVPLVLHF